jgi:hypothetical protein
MKAITLALAILVIPVAAQAATKHHPSHHVSRTARSGYAYQPQIACTQVGCLPVPRGCQRDTGRTIGGDPTAFDVVTCGNSTLYGNR